VPIVFYLILNLILSKPLASFQRPTPIKSSTARSLCFAGGYGGKGRTSFGKLINLITIIFDAERECTSFPGNVFSSLERAANDVLFFCTLYNKVCRLYYSF
jgi:hypothetical protein